MKKRKKWYHKIPLHELVEKKKYLEFFTALLSIPVLITVIILNFNSVNNLKEAKPTETPRQDGGIYSVPIEKSSNKISSSPEPKSSITSSPCKKELGPVAINSPEENETISNNPVAVIIAYDDEKYCAAVWAYRINGGNWSEYDDKSIALYNLPTGKIKLELKAKSLATRDEQTIIRTFTYEGDSTITTAPTPTATQTAPLE